MSRRPGRRGRVGGAVKFFPWANVPGCSAFYDSSRGLVLAGSNVTTAADQATGGIADPASGAAGLEPQFVASDGGGPAFDFATGRYFTLAHSTDFDFGSAFTVCGWIKRLNHSTQDHYMFSQSLGAVERLRLGPLSDNRMYALSDGVAGYVSCNYGTGLGWRHVAITYDGSLAAASRVAMYLDGALQAIVVVANFPATLSVVDRDRIGILASNNSSGPFNGSMAWLGIWKRALTLVEVQATMNYKRRT